MSPTLRAHIAQPEKLRQRDVAGDQHPVAPAHGPEHAVPECEVLPVAGRVPAHEEFHPVAVSHDQAGGEHHLAHVVDVADGDQVFQVVELADRNRQRDDHGEAGVDGAGHKVGREDRRMPAGKDGHREIEADDRVHGEHQRRCQAGQQQRGRLIAHPVPHRTAPAERQQSDRSTGPTGVFARSRRVPRSGIMPMYQKTTEMVA